MTQLFSPFASRSISGHLARGFAGLLAFAVGAMLMTAGGSLEIAGAVVALTAALILLRGCPMCWLIGLFETAAMCKRR